MKKFNKNILYLGIAFLLIAIGFNGVQQYLTSYFSDLGYISIGFNSLIIIYFFFAISSPISSIFVSKYGAKKSMILASIFYSLFIFSVIDKNILLIYLSSALLGIAAALIWTGQGTYLIRASEKTNFGKNAGIFTTTFFLGTAIGIFTLGFLIEKISFQLSFTIFLLFPLLGFLTFFKLKDIKTNQQIKNRFNLVKKSIKSLTALKLSSIWFSQSFVFGLSLGLIPLTIKNILGITFVSILLPLFYIMPILFSYLFGKQSDKIGRGKSIFFSYALGAIGLILIYFSTKTSIILGVLLLALSFASLKIVTFALPGDISQDHNLEFLTGLFWMIQNIGTLLALLISRFIQSNIAYIISLIILIISLVIVLSVFKLKFSKEKFEDIKEKLSNEIR